MSILKFLQSVAYKKELRSQLRLFIPFLLGQLCATGMGTVDTVMAGLAGTTEISGVAIGLLFLLACIPVLSRNGIRSHSYCISHSA